MQWMVSRYDGGKSAAICFPDLVSTPGHEISVRIQDNYLQVSHNFLQHQNKLSVKPDPQSQTQRGELQAVRRLIFLRARKVNKAIERIAPIVMS